MTTNPRSAPANSGGGGAAVRSASVGAHPDPLAALAWLTPRDRHLVGVLAEHQVLSTRQITQLAFRTVDTAQHRLVRLTRLGLFDRFRWHALVGSETWRYTLGPLGAALVAAQRGVEAPMPSQVKRRTLRLAASPRLAHLVGVNGWFCSLAGHTQTHPGTALAEWRSERRCAERYGELVRPDSQGVWIEDGRQIWFFLEYDTGSETIARVAAKLDDYEQLAAAGGPDHPVLIWLPSPTRETHLHQHLNQRPPAVAVATATPAYTQALNSDVAGPVWLQPGHEARRRLIDLPGGRGRSFGGWR